MRKVFAFGLLVMLVLSLAACQGYREIDSEYLISAVGFKEEGEKVRVYTEVLEVSAEKRGTKSRLFSDVAETPYEAVENIMGILPKKAVFDHCGTAIIESGVSPAVFKKIMRYLYDTKNLNLGICLYCARDIKKILSLKAQEFSIGYDIMSIKNNIEKTSGISFKNKYYEISGMEISEKGFSLPEIDIKDNCPQISAQTVYIKFSPVFHLSKGEMTVWNLMRDGAGGGETAIGGKRLRYNGIRVDKTRENGKIRVEIHCKYRSDKHRAAAELKSEAEKLFLKLRGNPAEGLILPCPSGGAGQVEVAVYDG